MRENLIQVHPVSFSFFEKPPASSMTEAFVYANQAGHYQVVKNGDRLTRSELRTARYTKCYTVTMSTLTFEYKQEIISSDRGRHFSIDLSIDYKVVDPVLLIQQEAGEISAYLNKKLPYWLETISSDFPISEAKRVKQKIEDLHENSSLVAGLNQVGINITDINVLVKQSANDLQHDMKFAAIDKQAELEEHKRAIEDKKRERELIEAKEIQSALESGDFISAILLAQSNPLALKLVNETIRHDTDLKNKIQDKMIGELSQTGVDSVAASDIRRKYEMFLPVTSQSRDNPETRDAYIDPLEDLSSYYQMNQTKGE